MKTLKYFLVMAIILIAGCSKDIGELDNPEVTLKRAKVPLPFKADCRAITDTQNPYKLNISGNASHFGKIDDKDSYYLFTSMDPTMINGQPYMALAGVGKLTGANGDKINFNFTSFQSLIDKSYYGTAIIIPGSGTGKFKGLIGSFDNHGGVDEAGVFFVAYGELSYE
jgi:hypothetical protein